MEYGNDALSYALWMLKQGYLEVDADGYIWRTAAFRAGAWRKITRRRAENVGGKGYLRLSLQINGKLRSVMAHRVIWTYLVGPIPESKQINHKDLNRQNNRIANLEVVSDAENIQHSYANGRRKPWSDSNVWRGKERLSKEKICEIRSDREAGMSYPDLSKKWGISTTHAHRLCNQ